MPDSPNVTRSDASDKLATLQRMLALHGGQLDNFDPKPPPTAIRRFLARATLQQLQGALVELLAAMRERQAG